MRLTRTILALTLAVLPSCRSYDPDVFDARLRSATFETYHEAIVDSYPDLDRVGLDSQSIRDRWEIAVVDAESATEYYHALGEMCATLDDPHLRLTPNYKLWTQADGPLGATDIRIAMVNGRPVLWNQYHDHILSLEGKTLDEVLPRDKNCNGWQVVSFDGIRPDKDIIADVINIGPHGTVIEIQLSSPDGPNDWIMKRKRGLEVEIDFDGDMDDQHIGTSLYSDAIKSSLEAVNERGLVAEVFDTHDGEYLFAWRIDDMGGIIWKTMRTLPNRADVEPLECDLAEAARILEGTRCTLLDFRFQGGGNGVGFTAMMESLLSSEVELVTEREWLFFRMVGLHKFKKSPSIIRGPVIILVNEYTASFGEWMTSLIRRERDATVIGTKTSGCEYCVIDIEAPDGSSLRFGGRPYNRTDGIPAFQSVGLLPDQLVTTDPEDLKDGSIADALVKAHERQTLAAWSLLEQLCSEDTP
ncbi:MAG: S41 family peptidase [Phycisphaerales bacterium]|nr:S41 family peptidase [Phycisphaerales bacterium]